MWACPSMTDRKYSPRKLHFLETFESECYLKHRTSQSANAIDCQAQSIWTYGEDTLETFRIFRICVTIVLAAQVKAGQWSSDMSKIKVLYSKTGALTYHNIAYVSDFKPDSDFSTKLIKKHKRYRLISSSGKGWKISHCIFSKIRRQQSAGS